MAIEFATIDFETTGLSPSRDRIIEIGVVRTDIDGNILSEFSSLINPQKDVTNSSIHGIQTQDLLMAPTFKELLGGIVGSINSAVLVAHNARFDIAFLSAELERAGMRAGSIFSLCTLDLMKQKYAGGPRKLVDCCSWLSIEIMPGHEALNDAKMASKLFHVLHQGSEDDRSLIPFRSDGGQLTTVSPMNRSEVLTPIDFQSSFLQELIAGLPLATEYVGTSAADVGEYMNLLESVLIDRRIDEQEASALVDLAKIFGFTQDKVSTIHAAFLRELCEIALEDNVVSELEKNEISVVAGLLKVDGWESLLQPNSVNVPRLRTPRLALTPSAQICIDVQNAAEREDLEQQAVRAGLVVRKNFNQDVNYLVTSDSNSLSVRVRSARDYGTPIISVVVFLQLIKSQNEVVDGNLNSRQIEVSSLLTLTNEGPPQNLQGKAIVVSGNLRKLTREAAESAIRVRGGRSPGSVSRKTFALVLGENPGANKQRSARELNIPVLDEAGFEVLLETGELPK